jgi:peptidoglycan/LPS O-acetylase OafA/YrhL
VHHSSGANRIEFLDGLRGLAISLVVLFHAYSRWPELVPYGSTFSDIMLFSYGWLGVQLFFLISGFVIFMTLDRCTNLSEFFARRWLRLFPAMLICSLFIWYTAPLFPERPAGPPTADQLIPSLTFVDPQWLQRFGIHAKPIEGVFWSLFVEAQFYVIAGASYFILGGRRAALAVLLILFAFAVLNGPFEHYFSMMSDSSLFRHLGTLSDLLGARFYGWFAAGALLYVYHSKKSNQALILGLAVTVAAVFAEHGIRNVGVKVPAALIAIVFVGTLLSDRMRLALSHRAFLFLGYISYPLYLVHENMMVALIVKIGKFIPALPAILMPLRRSDA